MDYISKNGDIIIERKDFSLDDTLDCGQSFRWKKTDENTYVGAMLNNPLEISQQEDTITFKNTSSEQFESIWQDYFDLDTDYSAYKKQFSADPVLKKACEYAGGIRILKQDCFEMLISFIFSQNNRIPRIKAIISRLVEHYGGFPSLEQLKGVTVEELDFLKSGFRAKYIVDAVSKLESGEVNLEKAKSMPTDEARQELIKIKGVGAKVSDCVMLFGMYKIDAFPIDVWVKRVMEQYYPDGLPKCVGNARGIAQQYLFHYIRTCKDL